MSLRDRRFLDRDSRRAGLPYNWLVVAILERTGLSRYVWHLPLFSSGWSFYLGPLLEWWSFHESDTFQLFDHAGDRWLS